MEYLNFIYFLLLFLFFYGKRKISSTTYISFIYMFSSFLSIFCVKEGSQKMDWNPSVVPTLVYWILTTLIILPVYKLEISMSANIKVNMRLLKMLCVFYFISLVLILVLYWQDFLFIMAYGNLGELRTMVVTGDFIATKYSGILGIILTFLRTINTLSFVMIPVFFILIKNNVSRKYSIMALAGSLVSVVQSALQIDRSSVIWWIIILGWCISYFWSSFSKTNKKAIRPYIVSAIVIIVIYFGAITISKFGQSNSGDSEISSSLVSYGGQSYPTWCFFWDNFQAKGYSTRTLFPMTHHFVFGDYDGLVALQQENSSKYNFDFGVFYTYLGTFLIDGGHIAPFIFVICYLLLFLIVLNSNKTRRSVISFEKFYILFCIIMIPTTGVISYFYSSPYTMFSAFFMWLVIRFFSIFSNKNKRRYPHAEVVNCR